MQTTNMENGEEQSRRKMNMQDEEEHPQRKRNVEDEEEHPQRKRNTNGEEEQLERTVNVEEEEDCDMVGPLLSESSTLSKKRRRVLQHEQLFLDNLPVAERYERSYMHRDTLTQLVCTVSDFLVTASCDGHIKFWRKQEAGIEFVKHFRAHLDRVLSVAASADGLLVSTVGADRHVKVFDVVNFDLINMWCIAVGTITPRHCLWVYRRGAALATLAVCDAESGIVHVYDGRGDGSPLHVLTRLHTRPITALGYNAVYGVTVSADEDNIVEYWADAVEDFSFPTKCGLRFTSKLDTDLFEFARKKVRVRSLCFSPDGRRFATMASDRCVRVFRFLTGKLTHVLNESIQHYVELQQARQQLPNMEFGKRLAVERELDKSEVASQSNVVFDESSNFLLYPTMLGIKFVNLCTKRLDRTIGKPEHVRFLNVALFQGKPKSLIQSSVTVEMEASENPTLDAVKSDPTVFCTAFKKSRFYLFSNREPDDSLSVEAGDRDVFNEKPSKEDMVAVTETSSCVLYESAIIHTSMGDIHVKLFPRECPKTVENFCVHSKNGYYNGHIFHRVIKAFMIQTGDPLGTGTGGQSIWGGEFDDELCPSLRHDRPYTLSMANAGPNTNGSQFFITLIPTPWLDNKHTVFGRCTRGMEVCQSIGSVKTNAKTDKPYDDVTIVSITVR